MRRLKTLTSWMTVAIMTAAMGFGLVQQAWAERTIALNTGTVELSLAQGGVAKDIIMVANNGDEPLKAMVYTSDIIYNAKGEPTYKKPTGAPGELLKSPASWLTLRLPSRTQVIANTPYIELDPGEEIELKFEMNVPADATPGDYNAAVFFEMFDTADSSDGAKSKVSGRIGARIVTRIAGDVVDQLELAPYAVRSFVIGDAVPYSFTLSNTGNIDKRYTPSLVVLDTTEAERMRSVIESNSVVYAKNARIYSGMLKLKNAAFGKYTVRAEMAYDRETGSKPGATVPERLVKDRTIFVVPVWFAILIVALIASPLVWWAVRSGTRQKGAHSAPKRSARSDGRGHSAAPEVESADESAPDGEPVAVREGRAASSRPARTPRIAADDDEVDVVRVAREFRQAHPELDDTDD